MANYEDSAEVVAARKKRAPVRAQVTRLLKKIDDELANDPTNIINLESMLTVLTQKKTTLERMDAFILDEIASSDLSTEEEVTAEADTSADIADRLTFYKTKLSFAITNCNKEESVRSASGSTSLSAETSVFVPRNTNIPSAPANNSQERPPEAEESSSATQVQVPIPYEHLAHDQSQLVLPKLEIAKYDGDVYEWTSFWSQFEAAVHLRNWHDTTKFTYLKSYLEGAAATRITGLSVTSENYKIAIDLLKNRFGRQDVLVIAHINKLTHLPAVERSNDIVELRKFVDICEVEVKSLQALGINAADSQLLGPIVMSKLPNDIGLDFSRLRQNDGIGQKIRIEELLIFLRDEVQSRERAFSFKQTPTSDTNNATSREPRAPRVIGNAKPQNNGYKPTAQKGERFSTVALAANAENTCIFCAKSHKAEECKKYTIEERKEILKKKARCYNCVYGQHLARFCNTKLTCYYCKKRHHAAVCENTEAKAEIVNQTAMSEISAINGEASTVLLQTALVIVYGIDNSMELRVLFDGGSQRTFIRENVSKQLNLPVIGVEELVIYPFKKKTPILAVCRRVKLTLRSSKNGNSLEIEALESPEVTSATLRVPDRELRKKLEREGLVMAEEEFYKNGISDGISILIGSDYYWKAMTTNCRRLDDSMVAMQSIFGWILQGPAGQATTTGEISVSTIITRAQPVEDENTVANVLKQFWEIESLGIIEKTSQSSSLDEEAMKKLEESITFTNGRYEVGLPWKEDNGEASNNLNVAMKRLFSLIRRFKRDPELYQAYQEVFDDYLKTGIIEEVHDDREARPLKENYLPHQPVIRKDRETTKTRVVFDGSSHDYNQPSINDRLIPGPNLNPDLLDIIIKFRSHKIAIVSDVEKAFLQISLSEKDRDAVRFLWFKDDPSQMAQKEDPEVIIYRMRRVLFGLTSSPFLLTATIKHHLQKYKEQYPETYKILNNDLYIDDLVSGDKNDESAFKRSKESCKIMEEGAMNLRKWQTNSLALRKKWQDEGMVDKHPSELEVDLTASTQMLKVLGISWHPNEDEFRFQVDRILEYLEEFKNTKRSVLQTSARVFDPAGYISPFTIKSKILFQEIWEKGVDWDDPLPLDLLKKFEDWRHDLPFLSEVTIPRYYQSAHLEEDILSTQLHCFTDASERAYGAVVYIRYETTSGRFGVSMVASKTRVCPIKKITLPRLELMGALIGARLTKRLQTILEIQEERITFWSDSLVTLHWIKGTAKKWQPFVSNRVSEIQQLADPKTWKFCKGKENPADFLSRGQGVRELISNEVWWNGPNWLELPEEQWPVSNHKFKESDTAIKQIIESEKRKCYEEVAQNSCAVEDKVELLDLNKYSTLSRPVRIIAWVMRFGHNTRNSGKKKSGELSAEELMSAEQHWVKRTQAEAFTEELKSLKTKKKVTNPSKIKEFNPFLDENEIIRVGGRLQASDFSYSEKHPILLPYQHRFSELQLNSAHQRVLHSGLSDTLAQSREEFWIVRGRQLAKKVLNRCIVCKKWKAQPASELTAPLPRDRVTEAPSFEITGMDFAGPVYVKNAGQTTKAYIALFTCGVTRAVHLELTSDLTTENFMLSFRRFVARKGVPRVVYSDNAQTFKRADKELKALFDTIEDSRVQNYFGKNGITWKYIVERAAWWGGFYERVVQMTKKVMKRILGRAFLSFEEMTTFLAETEATINSRPITYVNNAPHEPSPLTPSHFLLGKRATSLPPKGASKSQPKDSTQVELTKRWKYRQSLLEKLWSRWRYEYILELKSAHRVSQPGDGQIKMGGMVLLVEDKQPRQTWQLCRIVEVFKGRDGRVRSCLIKLPFGKTLRRPINLLCPLEIETE